MKRQFDGQQQKCGVGGDWIWIWAYLHPSEGLVALVPLRPSCHVCKIKMETPSRRFMVTVNEGKPLQMTLNVWWVPTDDSGGSAGQLGTLVLTWSACVPLSWPLLISTVRRAFSKSSCALSPRHLLSLLNFSSTEFSSWVWSDLFFHSHMPKPVYKGAGWIHQFWPFLDFSQGSSEKQQGIGLWSCRPWWVWNLYGWLAGSQLR